jgi:small subunit ribosomal protein S19
MSRSLYKGIYLSNHILSLFKTGKLESVREITTRDRSVTIIPQFIGKKIFIYNGKDYHSISVSPEMVGHKFGEFVGTRKRAVYKKKSVKKKVK